MAKIKAIIFDMDGVLVDARDLHYEALNAALSPFGMQISRDAHLAKFDGLSTRQKLLSLSETHGLPVGLHDLIHDLKQKFTQAKIHSHLRPTFSHRYMLSQLARENYRLACCSNSIRRSVDEMLYATNIRDFFEFVLSNEDVASPKPAPDIYRKAADLMGMRPEECLAVEDNINGLASARAAGVHVLAVADPSDVHYRRIADKLKQVEREAAL